MWRSVGSVGGDSQEQPPTPREENPYESFAQLSRLKNNVSQLSTQHPQHFLSEYFSKKRGTPLQVHSHHTLPRNSNLSTPLHVRSKNLEKRDKIETASIEEALPAPKINFKDSAHRLSQEVAEIREEYEFMRKEVCEQLEDISQGLGIFSAEVTERLEKLEEMERQRQQMGKNRGEVMSRITRDSVAWGEKMEELERRKGAVRSRLGRAVGQD